MLKLALLATTALLIAGQAYADPVGPCPVGGPPNNCPPPAGNVIFDNVIFDGINNQPVPHVYTNYTTLQFMATGASTNLSFAFREDQAFLELDNVTMFDVTTSLPVGVTNGDFESGPVDGQPVGWTFLNTFGAFLSGEVDSGCGNPGNCYVNGPIQGYNAITQAIATTMGDIYTVSFDLGDTGGLINFSQLSTNGHDTSTFGNGVDLLVYAGAVPVRAPEPASLALLGVALAGLSMVRRRKTA